MICQKLLVMNRMYKASMPWEAFRAENHADNN